MSTLEPALVPLVFGHDSQGKCILRTNSPMASSVGNANKRDGKQKRTRQYRPYISLVPSAGQASIGSNNHGGGGGGGGAVEFGRTEILTSLYAACGCLEASDDDKKETGKKSGSEPYKEKADMKKRNGAKLNLCRHCREAEAWATRFLSRKLMRLIPGTTCSGAAVHKNPSSHGTRTDLATDRNCTYRVQIRGENTPQFVSIGGSKCEMVRDTDDENDPGWKNVGVGTASSSARPLALGSIISFHYPSCGGKHSDESAEEERSGKSLHFQLCLVSTLSETGSASSVVRVEVDQRLPTKNSACRCDARNEAANPDDPLCSNNSASEEKVLSDDMEEDGSDDTDIQPLTQNSDTSAPRICQNGSCSESQHYDSPIIADVRANSLHESIPEGVAAAVAAGRRCGEESSQVITVDHLPSVMQTGENGSKSELATLALTATSPLVSTARLLCTSPAPNATPSTEGVSSSIPKDRGSISCALLPRCSPRRHSLRRHVNITQTGPAASTEALKESTADGSSLRPVSSRIQTVDDQSRYSAGAAVQLDNGPAAEAVLSYPRTFVPSDKNQSPTSASAEPASEWSQSIHSDTNTPHATQLSIIDLMTPESSGAAVRSNAITKPRAKGRSQESSAGVAMETTPMNTAASCQSVSSREHKAHPSPIDLTTYHPCLNLRQNPPNQDNASYFSFGLAGVCLELASSSCP